MRLATPEISARPNDKRHGLRRLSVAFNGLRVRHIQRALDLIRGAAGKAELADIGGDPDHGPESLLRHDPDVLSDCALVWPVTLSGRSADKDDPGGVLGVAL
jgi:hypothetical protein